MQNKLYQLFISRLDGDNIQSPSYQERVFELVKKGIGGFIIFGGEREEIKAFIDNIQSASDVPLFIASDIERGVGQQIKGYTEFPCQMAVRAAIRKDRPEDASLLKDVVNAIANEAIDVGINMPLMPVMDVNQMSDNPIICTRSFSDNPEDVSWFGREYIKVLEGSGLISCAKHFPGHGNTSIDSHISLPVITKSYKDLIDVDIMPFIEAIKAGVSSIMIGHLLIPVIDSMPASLSEKVIKGLLREKLGFDGLVITDALNMSALKGIDNLPAKCIKAGVDILLHPVDADSAVKELENAIRSKEMDKACIDRAVERILKFKSKLKHIKLVPEGLNRGKKKVDYNQHNTISTLITDMSITIVKGDEMLPSTDAHLILAGAEKFHKPYLWKGHFSNVSNISDVKQCPSDKTIIFAVFTEVSAWKGSSGIGDDEKQQIIELIKKAKGSIVISFGSPYILSHFKDADMLIAAYGAAEESQRAVIKCLIGGMECRGEMPVKL